MNRFELAILCSKISIDNYRYRLNRSVHLGFRKLVKSKRLWQTDGKVIFVHIPKNAGVSIYKTLGLPNIGHQMLSSFSDQELAVVEEIYFCTRDPVDRFVSAYNYIKYRDLKFNSFLASAIRESPGMNEFVGSESFPHFAKSHYFLKSQSSYLKGIHRFASRMRHIPFGELSDFQSREFPSGVATLNTTERREGIDSLTSASIAKINELYAADIELISWLGN